MSHSIDQTGGITTSSTVAVNGRTAEEPNLDDVLSTNSADATAKRSSTITIAASISGGFVGLIIFAAACTSVIWLSRHVQVQIRFTGKQTPNREEEGGGKQDGVTSSGIPVQFNTAYAQVANSGQLLGTLAANGDVVIMFAGRDDEEVPSSEGTSKEREYEREVQKMMSKDIVTNGGDKRIKFDQPLPEDPWSDRLIEDNDDHIYEYVK